MNIVCYCELWCDGDFGYVVMDLFDGFLLWKMKEGEEGCDLVSSRLGTSPTKFTQKLAARSIEKVKRY